MKKLLAILLLSSLTFILGCGEMSVFEVPETVGTNWYKGNMHTHTTNSDGDQEPYLVAKWYKDHGYDFLAITDHNMLTDPELIKGIQDSGFLLIKGNEVSSSNKKVPNDKHKRSVHMNALHFSSPIQTVYDTTMVLTLQKNIDAIRATGGVVHLNHPNHRWSYGSKEMMQLEGVSLFEIYNMHPRVNNYGSDSLESTEQMWDNMLTAGKRIYGLATDDAHNFLDFTWFNSNPGRGWVVVRANKLNADEITKNLEQGHFYASSGVELDDIIVEPTSIEIKITPFSQSIYRTDFIGDGGEILKTTYENPAKFELTTRQNYVRANILSSNGQRAWVQPVFVTTQ